MGVATLTVDLNALTANWRALDALSAPQVTTAVVVKADGYGLGAGKVSAALYKSGVRTFFVAATEEGVTVRAAIGPAASIYIFSGHMPGDADLLAAHNLTPLLNSAEQFQLHRAALPNHPFGVQLNSGMNRLGMEPSEFAGLKSDIIAAKPILIISHLACADEPDHPQNPAQLAAFKDMTDGLNIPRSLAATGGILLGPQYHFDLTRPGVGLYGGEPFTAASSVVTLSIPVVQMRDVTIGETVGYAASWTAKRPSKIATLSAGYADGLIRAMGGSAILLAEDGTPCPLVGRVSMDLLTVDITDLYKTPSKLYILYKSQGVDQLADAAGTIGYEILTSLGARYKRVYIGT